MDSTASPRTQLVGLATGVPDHRIAQGQARTFMARMLAAQVPPDEVDSLIWKLDAIYDGSGIDARYSVLADYSRLDPQDFDFYPKRWSLEPFPTTAERMAVFEAESVGLAAGVCERALTDAGVAPDEVTHLIVCTCTGFMAPGPGILLSRRLDLRPDVGRTQIGFMGCYAGFSGMRLADSIVRGDPEAVVLQVSLELCSLHFQRDVDLETIVANCLFADGCAAAVYAGAERAGDALAALRGVEAAVDGDSLNQMRWQIGDHGFRMGLSRKVPATLEAGLRGFVGRVTDRHALGVGDIARWALHPGGRRIVEAAVDALDLDETAADSAFDVLSRFGNMSSPTIFFVLERELAAAAPGDPMLALGFGPGLTMEAALLEAH